MFIQIVIDPMTETSKTKGNIEDTYVFTGGNVPENPGNVYAYGSFVVGRSDELGKNESAASVSRPSGYWKRFDHLRSDHVYLAV